MSAPIRQQLEQLRTYAVFEGDVQAMLDVLEKEEDESLENETRGYPDWVQLYLPAGARIDELAYMAAHTNPNQLVIGTGDCARLGAMCLRQGRRFFGVVPMGQGPALSEFLRLESQRLARKHD